MHTTRSFLFTATMLFCGCTPPSKAAGADGDSQGAGDSGGASGTLSTGSHTLEYDGLTRTFELHVPADLTPGAPLLVALHGYSSDGPTLQRYSEFDARADAHGFAVVYPTGTTDRWDYHYWEVGYDFHNGSVDDVGFIRTLAESISEDLGLGPVYATGMSNGGDMSYRLACEEPELVAAVAPVAGCMMGWLAEACTPANPVPVLEIHGTDDDVTLWNGDPENVDGWGIYLSTEDGLAIHTALLGLDRYEEETLPDLDPTDGSTVLARRWSRDDTDAAVWLLEVQGGAHDWPGAFGNQDIHASDVVWAFLSRYP